MRKTKSVQTKEKKKRGGAWGGGGEREKKSVTKRTGKKKKKKKKNPLKTNQINKNNKSSKGPVILVRVKFRINSGKFL